MSIWNPQDLVEIRRLNREQRGLEPAEIHRRWLTAYDNTPLQDLVIREDPAEEFLDDNSDDGAGDTEHDPDDFLTETMSESGGSAGESDGFDDQFENPDELFDGQLHHLQAARHLFRNENRDSTRDLLQDRLHPNEVREADEVNARLDNALAEIMADPNAQIEVLNINPEVLFGRPN